MTHSWYVRPLGKGDTKQMHGALHRAHARRVIVKVTVEVTVGGSHTSETQARVPYLTGTLHYTQHPPPEAARANGQVGVGGRAGRWKRHAGSLVLFKDTKQPKPLAKAETKAKSSSTLRHSYLPHTQTPTFASQVPTHVLSDTCPLSTEWDYFWLHCSNPVMLTPFLLCWSGGSD